MARSTYPDRALRAQVPCRRGPDEPTCTRVPPTDGQIFHAAGPTSGGWTIFAVHESKASREKFRDDTLVPKLSAGVAGGFTTAPQETEIELFSLQP